MPKTYIVYLDEFGHIGPYVSSTHPKHNTHPAFGLGGFVLPINAVRPFSSFFFELKLNLFENFDIKQAKDKAKEKGERFQLSTWEKKGSQQYSVVNLKKYKDYLVGSTSRIINRITSKGGFLFYVGEAKFRNPKQHNPQEVYKSSLTEIIKRLDDEFRSEDAQFLIFMDDSEGSADLVKKSIYEMHQNGRYQLIEAPMQVDSKLYQTIQCADWLCAIYGKIAYYNIEPNAKPEYELFVRYFADKIASAQKRSNVRNNLPKLASDKQLQKLKEKFDKRKCKYSK